MAKTTTQTKNADVNSLNVRQVQKIIAKWGKATDARIAAIKELTEILPKGKAATTAGKDVIPLIHFCTQEIASIKGGVSQLKFAKKFCDSCDKLVAAAAKAKVAAKDKKVAAKKPCSKKTCDKQCADPTTCTETTN